MSVAYALVSGGLASEVVLVDTNHEKAEGEALDLGQGAPFFKPVDVYEGAPKTVKARPLAYSLPELTASPERAVST